MIAGHFGLAAGVKAKAPETPLWALMLATAWLDVVFVPLFLGGIETLTLAPGEGPGYGHGIIHADYTHSLVGALVLSVLFGAFGAWRWGRRSGLVLGAVAMSHWVLDLVVHRMDMPWLPANWGDLPRLGFGLWQLPVASAAIEALIVAVGAWLYWSAARRLGEDSRRLAVVLTLLVLVGGLGTLALDFTGLLG